MNPNPPRQAVRSSPMGRDPSAYSSVGQRFVTSSTVRSAKESLDPFIRSLDSTAYECAQFSPERRAAWSRFLIAWEKFYTADDGFFTAGAEMDQFQQYERQFKAWEQEIGRTCQLASAPYSSTADAPTSPLVYVAVAAGILGLAWLANSAVTAAGGLGAILPRRARA